MVRGNQTLLAERSSLNAGATVVSKLETTCAGQHNAGSLLAGDVPSAFDLSAVLTLAFSGASTAELELCGGVHALVFTSQSRDGASI